MRTAWLNLVAFGSVTALIATACVVNTGDGDDDDETGGRSSRGGASAATGGRGGAGSGGTGGAGTAGKSSGGASSGGTTTGGTAMTGGGGAGGTGGTPPTPYCDGKGPPSDPSNSCEYDDDDLKSGTGKCLSCLTENCCNEIRNCHGRDASGTVVVNQCGAGGTEYMCYQDCLLMKATANGFYDPDTDPDACAASCVRTGCGTIGDFTSDVVGCMHLNCEPDCFEP